MLDSKQVQMITDSLTALGESRIPIKARDKVALQFRIERHDVLLFEKRPFYADPAKWIESSVAKFRWNGRAGTWSLLWRDRNACWHHDTECEPSPRFEDLVREVDCDPTGIFWA